MLFLLSHKRLSEEHLDGIWTAIEKPDQFEAVSGFTDAFRKSAVPKDHTSSLTVFFFSCWLGISQPRHVGFCGNSMRL